MERDSFLHRAIPWAVAVVVIAFAVSLGYMVLAGLMRVPEIPQEPQESHMGTPPHLAPGIGSRVFVVEDWRRMRACNAAETVCDDILVPKE